jgi:hypothetical protein
MMTRIAILDDTFDVAGVDRSVHTRNKNGTCRPQNRPGPSAQPDSFQPIHIFKPHPKDFATSPLPPLKDKDKFTDF